MKNYFRKLGRSCVDYLVEKVAGNQGFSRAIRTATESDFARLSNLVESRFLDFRQILDLKLENASAVSGFQALSNETALASAGLVARHLRLTTACPVPPSLYQRAEPEPFENYLERLKGMHPAAFETWSVLFENGKKSYYEQREASCSHRVHRYAMLFGAYIELYGFGRMLDVGCGPHGLPSYLATHDPALISGIEPLPPTSAMGFECARGFNEFLPWPDESFHTVLSGTSLDHVLSLDASLAEVRRVLTPDGRYLVWLASIAGAKPYDPESPDLQAIDDFHMFHFDRLWIEPIFEKYFKIKDVKIITQSGFDHVFYCMTK